MWCISALISTKNLLYFVVYNRYDEDIMYKQNKKDHSAQGVNNLAYPKSNNHR